MFGCRGGLRTSGFGKPASHVVMLGYQNSFGTSFGMRRFISDSLGTLGVKRLSRNGVKHASVVGGMTLRYLGFLRRDGVGRPAVFNKPPTLLWWLGCALGWR